MKVIVAKEILKANDQVAAENRETFDGWLEEARQAAM